MTYYVYILYSEKFDRFYVGSTTDIAKRLYQHNNKESSFTAGGVPWRLVWSTRKPSRFEAEQLENKLKNLSKARKLQFMKKYHEGLQNSRLLAGLLTRS